MNAPTRSRARAAQSLYDDLLAPGAIVGNYTVEALRAHGGFGSVYRARHRRIGRLVAIKLLHRELARSGRMLERFEREARLVNQIGHAAIVDIHDCGEMPDGRPYLVMEWLPGLNLREHLERHGASSTASALAVLEDLAAALEAAHAHGIVHRDVKAANVVGAAEHEGDGHCKLIDFGIACVTSGGSDGLRTDLGLGSLRSMAPEQLRGTRVDPRTDVFAVGLLLCHLLLGRPLISGRSPAEVAAEHGAQLPAALAGAPQLDRELRAVLARCLHPDPAMRQQSIRELMIDVRRAAGDHPPRRRAMVRR